MIVIAREEGFFQFRGGKIFELSPSFLKNSPGARCLFFTTDTEDLRVYVSRWTNPGYHSFVNTSYYGAETLQEQVLLIEALMDLGIVREDRYYGNAFVEEMLSLLREREPGLLRYEEDDPYVEDAFYGGRNEAYRLSTGPAVNYDINSAYAWVFTEPLPDVSRAEESDRLRPPSEEWFFIFHGRVRVPEETYLPPLPVKVPSSEEEFGKPFKTYYPAGEFEGVWSSLDLTDQVEVLSVKKVIYYPLKEFPYLESVVRTLYMERKHMGGVLADLLKLQLVRLYGNIAFSGSWKPRNRLVGLFVNAKVRKRLYETALRFQESLAYVDTDSMILEGKEGPVLSSSPGGWGMRERYRWVKFYGVKRYVFEKEDGKLGIRFAGETTTGAEIDLEEEVLIRKRPFTGRVEVLPLRGEVEWKRHLVDGYSKPFLVSEVPWQEEKERGPVRERQT